MTLTRDQLRAARILLHLPQDQLAKLSLVGLATIRRFETGRAIGPVLLDALRRTIENEGVILLNGGDPQNRPDRGLGVALKREADLPMSTRKRIADDEVVIEKAQGASSSGADGETSGGKPPESPTRRGRGRPRKPTG